MLKRLQFSPARPEPAKTDSFPKQGRSELSPFKGWLG